MMKGNFLKSVVAAIAIALVRQSFGQTGQPSTQITESRASLIESLKAGNGSAAWKLSQLGGQDASDALLDFLNACVQNIPKTDCGNLARAVEAEKELPDKRALALLMKCLEIGNTRYGCTGGGVKRDAIQALGKIGDPQASELLAQQLSPQTDYVTSIDYLTLDAIRNTGDQKAVPYLVHYFTTVSQRVHLEEPENPPTPMVLRGREARQTQYNGQVYWKTLAALKAITGREGRGDTPQAQAEDWDRWLRFEYNPSGQAK
jgi:HEAT repeat protein